MQTAETVYRCYVYGHRAPRVTLEDIQRWASGGETKREALVLVNAIGDTLSRGSGQWHIRTAGGRNVNVSLRAGLDKLLASESGGRITRQRSPLYP